MLRLPSRPAFTAVVVLGAALVMASCSTPPSPPAASPAPAAAPQKKATAKLAPTPAPEPPAPAPAPAPTKAAAAPSNQFKVTAARTPFYNYGPQQPGGPSMSLDRGTVVTLLKRGFGYSQVKLRNEQTGYIGTEDMVALTAEELLAQEQPEAPATGDFGALPRPGGVRRSTLPPATPVDLPVEMPISADPEPKAEATPSPKE